MVAVTRLLARLRFLYDFVNTGIFRYFKLEILHRLLSRHTLLSMNTVEVFGSFSQSKKTAYMLESQFY